MSNSPWLTSVGGRCAHCGQEGHRAKHGNCSPVHRAALRVISGELTTQEAAERFGVSKQSVSEAVRRARAGKVPP